MPSIAVDDYLKTIYHHTEWQNDPMSSSELAAALGLAPSSVTEMVRKLVDQGLVRHSPYGPVTLTDAGARRAASVIRRHRLVETLLVQEFDYAWDEVHEEAEVLEHVISERLLDAVDRRLGRPRVDPHGDAIPDASGAVSRTDFLLLRDAPAGHTGRVLRVSDRDPDLLRAVGDAGLRPGAPVVVVDPHTVQDADGAVITLPRGAAEAVWLSA